jgi:hypothetical protein
VLFSGDGVGRPGLLAVRTLLRTSARHLTHELPRGTGGFG